MLIIFLYFHNPNLKDIYLTNPYYAKKRSLSHDKLR